jgi:hypothetical protein
MAQYINDLDLYYEIVVSKGKGKLTKKAENMLILIAKNTIRKKKSTYKNQEDMEDCLQQGILRLFENWKGFNEKKYTQSLPYYTEIFKRGIADGHNQIYNKKSYNDDNIKLISLDHSNEGKGLHNI